ncbi:aldo/keto reductase [Gracilimonas sp.]|uniref:aldo/keto reductase n=1 Tax=Gracilimonas sp. TaxID=1974203 RepID=UPI003D0CAF45
MNLKAKIGLGTVQFGLDYGISNVSGKTPKKEVRRILEFAQNEDIDTLDTANAYGNAETLLGSIGVENFKVVSKFLPEQDLNTSIEEQLKKTLSRLKINSLYGYLAHRPGDILDNPGQWKSLKRFKEQGNVNKIGFSLNDPNELKQLLERNFVPDLVQVPFNYFDRRFEVAMKQLHSKGCEIHSRSTFLQGLFFKDPETLPSHFEEVKAIIQRMKHSKCNLAGSLLRYVLEKPFIDKVIVGVESKDQLFQNIRSIEIAERLPQKDFEITNSILNPSKWPKN